MGISTDASRDEARYTGARRSHWEGIAREGDHAGLGGYYHRRLRDIYRAHVPAGQRVLELGCGTGDLLAAVQPARGLGVDLSPAIVAAARARHSQLAFEVGDAHELSSIEGPFDVVILSDLLNDLWDVQAVFGQVARLSHPGTRLIVNNYSRLWELPLAAAKWLRLARPRLHQNWLTVEDVSNLMYLANFEVVKRWQEVLWPVWTPGIDAVANKFLVKLWPFNHLALTNFIVARPRPRIPVAPSALRVSVVVPARNEAGNIEQIFARTPEMGAGTEMIFIEGHSKDDTYQAIEAAIARHPERLDSIVSTGGHGKRGRRASGIPQGDRRRPDDSRCRPHRASGGPAALLRGAAIGRRGVRQRRAARLPDGKGGDALLQSAREQVLQPGVLVASRTVDQGHACAAPKCCRRANYERVAANRAYFGDFDPFGDFDLLFGAARLSLRIVDLPIRYRERTYGTTNIQRWRHGWLLLRMLLFAARRLKFV